MPRNQLAQILFRLAAPAQARFPQVYYYAGHKSHDIHQTGQKFVLYLNFLTSLLIF